MSHRFVSASSSAGHSVKRALVGAALVATGYLAALLASISVAIVGGTGSGNASDVGAAAPSEFAQKAVPDRAAPTDRTRRDFDYFPDHYANQGSEVAEQPPTF
jgi:hypothetical protein